MHDDPLNVLDIAFVNVANTCFPPPPLTSYVYSLYPRTFPYISPLPPSFPTSILSYVQPTIHPNTPPLIFLQSNLISMTALLWASSWGHTEIVKALLTVPGIDVNHADVSSRLLTPSYVVVGCVCLIHIYLP